jgi:hypothetical protein
VPNRFTTSSKNDDQHTNKIAVAFGQQFVGHRDPGVEA